MWFWQHKNVRKQYALWAQLLFASAVAHFFFLCGFFFMYHGDTVELFLHINARNLEGAPVVFRTVVPQRQTIQRPPVKKVAKAVPQKTPRQVKKVVQKKVVPPKPKPIPKTTVAQKKPVQKPAAPKKEVPKVAANKQMQQKPTQPTKPKTPEKQVVQTAKPKLNPTAEKQKKEVEQIAVTPSTLTTQQDVVGIPEYVFAFQQQIAQKFTPPIGIASDAQCQIKMMISWEGAMQDVTVEQSSGILMYDVAARSAVHKLSLPRWTWGKSLTIVFKQ